MRNTILLTVFVYLIAMPALFGQKAVSGMLRYKTVFAASPSHAVETTNQLLFSGDKSLAQQAQVSPVESQSIAYHKNLTTKRLISREYADDELVIVDDELVPVSWKILPEQKVIGRFRCQKAQGRVRGRDYKAWFAPAVAVSSGPWKLHGLPGLILEAEDATGEVRFVFESLTIPAPANVVVAAPVPIKGQKRMTHADLQPYIIRKYDAIRRKLEAKPGLTNTRVEISPGKTIEMND